MEFKSGFKTDFRQCFQCKEAFDAEKMTQRWNVCSIDCLNKMKAKSLAVPRISTKPYRRSGIGPFNKERYANGLKKLAKSSK